MRERLSPTARGGSVLSTLTWAYSGHVRLPNWITMGASGTVDKVRHLGSPVVTEGGDGVGEGVVGVLSDADVAVVRYAAAARAPREDFSAFYDPDDE